MPGKLANLTPYLVKRFSQAEIDSGTLRTAFEGIPRVAGGRVGYVVGLFWDAVCQFDTTAANMTAAYDGERILETIKDIKMNPAGVSYFAPGIDAHHLRVDRWLRTGRQHKLTPSDLADQDNTDLQHDVELLYPFGNVEALGRALARNRGPNGEKAARLLDGAIPLAAFNPNHDWVLQWSLDNSSLPGSPAGVTNDGYQEHFELYAWIYWSEKVFLAPKFEVVEKIFAENEFAIERDSAEPVKRLDYAIVHPRQQDTGGQDVTSMENWTIRHGDRDWVASRSQAQMRVLGELYHEDSALETDTPPGSSDTDDLGRDTFIPLTPLHPGQLNSEGVRPPVEARTDSNGGQDQIRTQYRKQVALSAADQARMLEAIARSGARVNANPDKIASGDVSPSLLPQFF